MNMKGIEFIDIPRGCKRICIKKEDDGTITTLFVSEAMNERIFLCEETGELEVLPNIGDFAIFWNEKTRQEAVVCNLKAKDGESYVSSSCEYYEHAIKFRDYKQYLQIKGIHGDE